MTRAYLVVLGLLLAATTAFGADVPIEFESPRQVQLRSLPASRIGFGDDTLVRTADGLVLVDWSRPVAERDSVLHETPLAISGSEGEFIAWGDSLVAMAPFGQAPHLIIHAGPDGMPVIETVDDPDWVAANCWLGGLPYLGALVGSEVRLTPALGGPHDPITIETEFEFWPLETRFAGDRCVGIVEDYDDRDHGGFQVWDLSDPLDPRRGPVVTAAWQATDAVIDGHVLYLGAGTLQAWDISDVDAPVLLDELGPASRYHRMALRSGGHLAAWLDESYIRVADISDPADLRIYKSHIPPWPPTYFMAPLTVEDRRVVVSDPAGLRALEFPPGDNGNITDGGLAWPRWGELSATDGVRVWIQGSERYLADLAAETMERVAEPTAPAPDGEYPGFLAFHRDHLLYAPGDGRFVVENVSDPRQAEVVYIFPGDAPIGDHALRNDLLALRSGQTVLMFDVTDPAQPVFHGSAATEPCDGTVMALMDGLLVVGHVHDWDRIEGIVYATDGGGQCPESGRFEIPDLGGTEWRFDTIGSEFYIHGIRSEYSVDHWQCDLSDPGAPILVNLWDLSLRASELGMFPLEANGDTYLTQVVHGELSLQVYEGTLPEAYPPLASVDEDGTLFAAVNDRVFLSSYWAVGSYRVAGLGLSDATLPVPPDALIISPNPFNARVRIAFTMDRDGPAQAALYDLRGRHVRTLAAELPAGDAALDWDGRDDSGRDLPSGIYFVRVVRPTGTVRGRCTLVR